VAAVPDESLLDEELEELEELEDDVLSVSVSVVELELLELELVLVSVVDMSIIVVPAVDVIVSSPGPLPTGGSVAQPPRSSTGGG
jgi:hypothetical protein